MVGAIFALWVMHEPFGFMPFLGVASLVGVIVSHPIVLFDFIEEVISPVMISRTLSSTPESSDYVRS